MGKKRKAHITKASGMEVPYSESVLRKSLARSGASRKAVDEILHQIGNELYDGMPTEQIYEQAFALLRSQPYGAAARYKLKKSIMELGPTGFPFEQFMGRLFGSMGYATQTGQLMKGACVRHEVDVVARKGPELLLMECKYHQQPGYRCDVKVPLYISARFRDIEQEWRKTNDGAATLFQGWVATNTHFTDDAVSYGLCAGLRLIGWDFPAKGSLKELIDRQGLYPVTALTTLTGREKQQLLADNIVLTTDILNHRDRMAVTVPAPERLSRIFSECSELSNDGRREKRKQEITF